MKKLFVLFAAVALVCAFTLPVAAAEWGFYGSARMATWSTSNNVSDAAKLAGQHDDTDTRWDLQGNSRIGARVKAGDVGGRFEYGSGPNLRLLYGTWNFGAGTLLVGQAYTPTFVPLSNQVYGDDTDMLWYGGMMGSCRQPMIQVSAQGFKLALVRPNVGVRYGVPGTDTDSTIPKIEASYSFKAGPAAFTVFGGYNSYTAVDNVTVFGAETDYDIDSHLYGIAIKYAGGPFYVKGDIYFGQNLNAYGFVGPLTSWAPIKAPGADTDVDDFGWMAVAGFKLNDMFTFEAGYGQTKTELDSVLTNEDDTAAYYVNASITLAKGVFLVPEVGKIDFKDRVTNGVSADQGDRTYFGAKWQINF